MDNSDHLRKSFRLRGIHPVFEIYIPEIRKRKMAEETMAVLVTPAYQKLTSLSNFCGDLGEDTLKWLKEYDRVTKFNK